MARSHHGTRQTVTRADIADEVYKKLGLSRAESAHLVETVLSNIVDGLIDDGFVKISSFGNFTVNSKNERVGRNPKTGVEVPITARKVLTFKVSPVLKKKIDR